MDFFKKNKLDLGEQIAKFNYAFFHQQDVDKDVYREAIYEAAANGHPHALDIIFRSRFLEGRFFTEQEFQEESKEMDNWMRACQEDQELQELMPYFLQKELSARTMGVLSAYAVAEASIGSGSPPDDEDSKIQRELLNKIQFLLDQDRFTEINASMAYLELVSYYRAFSGELEAGLSKLDVDSLSSAFLDYIEQFDFYSQRIYNDNPEIKKNLSWLASFYEKVLQTLTDLKKYFNQESDNDLADLKSGLASDIDNGYPNSVFMTDEIYNFYTSNRVDMLDSTVMRSFQSYTNSLINIEVSKMQVTTKLRDACTENDCNEKKDCKTCGKDKTNNVSIMTANSDGDYLVLDLSSKEEGEVEGVLVYFQPENYNSIEFSPAGRIYFDCQKLVPLQVAVLETDSDSMLFFADDFAHIDGTDFISSIKVRPGKYYVFAWIGFTMVRDLAPIAVTLFHEAFKEEFKDLVINKPVQKEFVDCVHDSLSGLVGSRMDQDQHSLADMNFRFNVSSNPSLARSWHYQLIALENGLEAFNSEPVEDQINILEALRVRGLKTLSDEGFKRVLRSSSDLSQQDVKKINENLATNAGVILLDDIENNNLGHILMSSGEKARGLSLIRKAASNGQPNALATLIWTLLLSEDFDGAIESFDTFFPLTTYWIDEQAKRVQLEESKDIEMMIDTQDLNYQRSNIKSNAALAFLAKGDKSKALELWDQAARENNHVEARLYPLVISYQNDQTLLRETIGNKFHQDEIQELLSDMKSVLTEAKGWFANFAKDVFSVLEKIIVDESKEDRISD